MTLFSPALQFGINKYVFGVSWLTASDETAAKEFTRTALAGLRQPQPHGAAKK